MKIVNRQQFLALPEGVLFSRFERNCTEFSGLNVKGQSGEFDFILLDLFIIYGKNAEDTDRIQDEMREKGASAPLNDAYERDGLFDEDELFCIYERADLLKLKELIDNALVVTPS